MVERAGIIAVERVEGRQRSVSAQAKELVNSVRRASVKRRNVRRLAMIAIYGR